MAKQLSEMDSFLTALKVNAVQSRMREDAEKVAE